MGFREILLLAIALGISLVALVRPKVGMYGYIWYSLMRPDILAYVEVKYPLSLVFAVATALGSIPHLSRIGVLLRSATSRYLLLLQIPIGLSIIFALQPQLDMDRYSFYVRNVAILLLIPLLIRTEEDLRTLVFIITASLGIVGFKFGLYGVATGGANFSSASYGDMLGDNNFMALAFAAVIPLAWYCRLMTTRKALKLAFAAIVAGCSAAVIMSGSRGGSISLALGICLLVLKAKRKMGAALVLIAGVIVAIYLVHDEYSARMSTLEAPEQEASAASRLLHARAAYGVWLDHPFLGVGFGGMNYAAIAESYGAPDSGHVAHNTYLQMLADSGAIAFLLFCAMFWGAIRRLWRKARSFEGETAIMGRALATSLTVFAVGATFYSCQRMDLLYILLMCAASYELITRSWESSEDLNSAEIELVQSEPLNA